MDWILWGIGLGDCIRHNCCVFIKFIRVRQWDSSSLTISKVMIKAAKDVRAAKFMHERHPMLGVMGGWGDGSLDTTKNTSQNKRHVYMYTYMYVYIYTHNSVGEHASIRALVYFRMVLLLACPSVDLYMYTWHIHSVPNSADGIVICMVECSKPWGSMGRTVYLPTWNP